MTRSSAGIISSERSKGTFAAAAALATAASCSSLLRFLKDGARAGCSGLGLPSFLSFASLGIRPLFDAAALDRICRDEVSHHSAVTLDIFFAQLLKIGKRRFGSQYGKLRSGNSQ